MDEIKKDEEKREQRRIKRKEYRNSKKKKKGTGIDPNIDTDNTDYEATNIPYDSDINNDNDIEV